ncbi:MAG: YtxH domain-containing protein [Chloroflexi bacterium]|nr:YtxH domain-containing protein [Chloroflexota bacterium]
MVNHNYNHEQDNDASEPGGFWAGLLAGLLIGGLAGALALLLLAPRSGKKTRAKLQRQSHELRKQTAETVEDAVAQARGKARHITHDVRRQAHDLEQRGQAMLDGQKDNLASIVEAGKNAVQGNRD